MRLILLGCLYRGREVRNAEEGLYASCLWEERDASFSSKDEHISLENINSETGLTFRQEYGATGRQENIGKSDSLTG